MATALKPLSDRQALALIRRRGPAIEVTHPELAERFGWSPSHVKTALAAWAQAGAIRLARNGRKGTRITVLDSTPSENAASPRQALPAVADAGQAGDAATDGRTVEAGTISGAEQVPESQATPGHLNGHSSTAAMLNRTPENPLPVIMLDPAARTLPAATGADGQQPASLMPVPRPDAPAATAEGDKNGKAGMDHLLPTEPAAEPLTPAASVLPADSAAVPHDGRITVNPTLANLVVQGLGIAAGLFFAWKGYTALSVSIPINTAYAESLGATGAAKDLLRSAFAVIGYLAAFGAPAVETLRTLGHHRAAFKALLITVFCFAFGLHAAMGFVAANTDATTKARDVFLSRLAQADSRAAAAQAALDRIGVAAWSPADGEELAAKVRSLPGGERACNAARPAPAVIETCRRIAELRDARSSVGKAEAARVELASATADRKGIEAEAAAKGIVLGTDADPVAHKVADHVQAATFGWLPLTPRGVAVAGFLFEALAPELAVLACFWLSGVLLTGSCAALFRRRT